MKKLISFVLVLTMLVGMTVLACAEGRGSFVVSSAAAAPGEEVQITVSLQNNPGLASIEFDVIYDETVLEWTAVSQGEYTGLWDARPGVSVTWFSTDGNWTNDGLFCTLSFRVKDGAEAGETEVSLWYDEEEVYNWDEVNVPYDIQPGKVIILGEEAEPLTALRAEVFGNSVSLEGSISLNYYMILPEELVSDPDACVTLNGARYPISEAPTRSLGEDTLYRFAYPLEATRMGDEVRVMVFTGEGRAVPLYRHSSGENLSGTGYGFSVRDYIRRTLETGGDEKLTDLVQAMSDYGSLALLQRGYEPDQPLERQGDLDSVTAESLAAFAPAVTPGSDTGLSFVGADLALKPEIAVRIFFSLDKGEIGDYSFKLDGEELTPVPAGGKYYVELPAAAARDLDKSRAVTVTGGAGTVLTVQASVLSCVHSLLNRQDADMDLLALAKGLVLYNRAANAYFD